MYSYNYVHVRIQYIPISDSHTLLHTYVHLLYSLLLLLGSFVYYYETLSVCECYLYGFSEGSTTNHYVRRRQKEKEEEKKIK